MKRALAVVVLLAAPLTAGCFAGNAETASDPRKRGLDDLDLTQPVEVLAPDRPVRASTMMHEEVDPATVDMPFADGDDGWAPRDVAITDHGVQEVYDEFGRAVPAYVFRFEQMVFVTDDITFTPNCSGSDCVDIDGHYEPHTYEYTFDRADGRALGIADLDAGWRVFYHPDFRHPYSGPLVVLFMALKVLGDDLTREYKIWSMDGHDLWVSFAPFDGFRPMPGDCAMWELVYRWDPPLSDLPEVEVEAKEHHTIVCLEQGELIPLWTFSGNQVDGGYRLSRSEPTFPLPDFGGEALPAVQYPMASWQEVGGLLPVPEPLLMPPTDAGGTWAQALHERAKALYLSPGYVLYRLQSELPYVHFAWTGLEQLNLLAVLNITLPAVVPMLETMTFFDLTDAKQSHAHVVHSRDGGPEQPDLHIAQPEGNTFPEMWPVVPTDQIPDLVPDAFIEGQLGALIPIDANMLLFWYLNFADFAGEPMAIWFVIRDCTEQLEGQELVVDAVRGFAQSVSVMPPEHPECDPEGIASRLQPGRAPSTGLQAAALLPASHALAAALAPLAPLNRPLPEPV